MPDPMFVELGAAEISEGDFLKQLDGALRKAFHELREYEQKSGSGTGVAKVVATIAIKRAKDMQEHYAINFGLKRTVPTSTVSSVVKEKGGRLLCRPQGSSHDTPDQRLLFDATGKPIAGVDPVTGEDYSARTDGKGVAGRLTGRTG